MLTKLTACPNCGAIASSLLTGLVLPAGECQTEEHICLTCGHDVRQRPAQALRPGSIRAATLPSLCAGKATPHRVGYVAALASPKN